MAMYEFLALVCLTLSAHNVRAQTSPVVETTLGSVQGIVQTNVNGREFYAFRGIPFAQPPIGDLRFQRPEAAAPWDGVRDGSQQGPVCLQYNSGIFMGHENCLYLNVYIPQLPSNSSDLLPVMVYVYGGGFSDGGSLEVKYGSGKFMDYGVVTVTFNYRINVFGFLTTSDQVLPGNAGMWDQVMALTWVQENIASFGGDPTAVTVFGESAGAMSVGLHLISPQSKGLFRSAISESGSPLHIVGPQQHTLSNTRTFALAAGCPQDDSQLLRQCLTNQSADAILRAYAVAETAGASFWPVVDSYASPSFLPYSPIDAYNNGTYPTVPFIIGANDNEGGAFYFGEFGLTTLNSSWFYSSDFVQFVSGYVIYTDPEVIEEVADLVFNEYFTGVDLNNMSQVQWPMMEFVGDSMFYSPTRQYLELLPKGQNDPPFYSYIFSYEGKHMASHLMTSENLGVWHADELVYILNNIAYDGGVLEGNDNVTSHRMLTMWTNFAKYGDPTPDDLEFPVVWEPVTSSTNVSYLRIGTDLTMMKNWRERRMEFWDNIADMFGTGASTPDAK